MEAADVAARSATGSDLIQALTMRGHAKTWLKDYKVSYTLLIRSLQGIDMRPMLFTRRPPEGAK